MENHWIERLGDFVSRKIDGEVIIISADGRHMHMLNETASLIWSCVEQRRSMDHLVDVMCREYAVTHTKARNDILAAAMKMAEKNLVRIDSTGNP